eukprot:CAMPEP_0119551082 /NCGR_PEP_ID=MMETSP1352-20130426/4452_1 /TAXON_ID=265584 /ORGANISM="Stauroneis constricta, Strain CCMP1120" /LENGTH=284 /DNA_ID=CAMNT_0007597091 /DNA_START=6 /DNA_END=860 /DNA_ORIENTATION=-
MRIVGTLSALTLILQSIAPMRFAEAGESSTAALSKSWTLLHSFNGGQDFSRRGVIGWDPEKQELDVQNDEGSLSSEDLKQAKETGWYQVKAVPSDAEDSSDYAMATVPACHIQRANFRDEFSLLIGRDDSLISLSYNPLISPLAPKDCNELESANEVDGLSFSSKAALELDRPGMVIRPVLPNSKPPPGMKFIPNPNNSRKNPDGTGVPPNEPEPITGPMSFIRRYWYVVLPLVLANFIGGDPEEGQPQEGGEQQQQQQQAAAGPAAAPAGGAATKRARRGKRN